MNWKKSLDLFWTWINLMVIPHLEDSKIKKNTTMSRPNNPQNRYDLICRVTGKQIKTNPRQFQQLSDKYGITLDEMEKSYVSREGRAVLMGEKLTPDQAVRKYSIHPNVASLLKATRYNGPSIASGISVPVVPVVPTTVVDGPAEPVSLVIIAAVEIEEPEDPKSEYSYDPSKDEDNAETEAMAQAG